MTNPVGRPIKYRHIIEQLLDDELYTPAAIVNYAEALGLLHVSGNVHKQLLRQRIRVALGRLTKNHYFPMHGDGLLHLKNQSVYVAWFGSRWKDTLPPIEKFKYQLRDTEAPSGLQE